MIDYQSIFLALSILTAGFFVIGPNILAVMGTSMSRGRAAGAQMAMGVGTGSGLWATLTVVGVTAVVASYAWTMVALKVFAVLYLSWLAFKAIRSATNSESALAIPKSAVSNPFWGGFTVQMTNPKAPLHWMAIVSLGLGSEANAATGIALVLSATALSISAHCLYAVLFSTGSVVRQYQRFRRWVESVLAGLYILAAFKIATHNN